MTTENEDIDLNVDENAKAAERKLLNEVKQAKAALKRYENIDPDKYARLLALEEAAETKQAEAKGEYEKLLKARTDKFTADETAYKDRLSKRDQKLLSAEVAAAISAEEGSATLLSPHVKSRVSVNDDGDVVVLDEAGEVMVGKTVTDLVKELKKNKEFESAFKSTAITGGGATKTAAMLAAGEGNPWLPGATWNMRQQAMLERQNPNLAAQYKAAAKSK